MHGNAGEPLSDPSMKQPSLTGSIQIESVCRDRTLSKRVSFWGSHSNCRGPAVDYCDSFVEDRKCVKIKNCGNSPSSVFGPTPPRRSTLPLRKFLQAHFSRPIPKGCQIVSSPQARKNEKGLHLLRLFHERRLPPMRSWGQRNILPEFNSRKSESHAMKNYLTRPKMAMIRETWMTWT